MTTTEKLASSIGKGLVAGLIGTASMTVSSTVEARLRHRKPSSAPARATNAAKLRAGRECQGRSPDCVG
jgi:hypothetical protein